MFSYTFKIRRIQNSKLKAFVSITIDEILDIDGFKIIDGVNGLFVSAPSHKGTVTEDGVKVEKWFDDIRFPTEAGLEFANELKAAIIKQYQEEAGSPAPAKESRGKAAKAQASIASEATPGASNAARKPLWGF
ncbi:MAG: septation protein SpoVG family protein [Gammaproteobacteria bacterium]|nr:septation protein SpoVG family protein [Gammaproteobacteria bacterium]